MWHFPLGDAFGGPRQAWRHRHWPNGSVFSPRTTRQQQVLDWLDRDHGIKWFQPNRVHKLSASLSEGLSRFSPVAVSGEEDFGVVEEGREIDGATSSGFGGGTRRHYGADASWGQSRKPSDSDGDLCDGPCWQAFRHGVPGPNAGVRTRLVVGPIDVTADECADEVG